MISWSRSLAASAWGETLSRLGSFCSASDGGLEPGGFLLAATIIRYWTAQPNAILEERKGVSDTLLD